MLVRHGVFQHLGTVVHSGVAQVHNTVELRTSQGEARQRKKAIGLERGTSLLWAGYLHE
jgi:hypothetical protein